MIDPKAPQATKPGPLGLEHEQKTLKQFSANFLLDLQKLNKTFRLGSLSELPIIHELSLTLAKGDFVTVIGPNGTGKSTLFNMIAGSASPDSGKIFFHGIDVTSTPEHLRATYIGRVFQDPTLGTASELTIGENLALAYSRGKKRTLKRAFGIKEQQFFRGELCKLELGLEERIGEKMKFLSGGQRQAVSLLMACLQKPDLILLDEHTAALDPKASDQILLLTRRLIQDQGLTALMITHNLSHAIQLGNRLVMLKAGSVFLDVKGDEKESLAIETLRNFFAEQL